MEYEKDFVKEDIIDLDIEGYPKDAFLYKPTTAGDEIDWLGEYIEMGEDGKPVHDYAKLNKLKMQNLVKVPYKKELIKKIINIDKEWKDLNIDEKWNLLRKLKSGVFDKILDAIKGYDKGDNEAKKD